MASYRSNRRKKPKTVADTSLCEIDYAVTSKLMESMDYDKGWEELAIAASYKMPKILKLKSMHSRGESPTNALIWDMGIHGFNVRDLYLKLEQMNRIREMGYLEDYE